MKDPKKSKPDTPPSPERDTSREGREEEVINQQEGNNITNSDSNAVVNGPAGNSGHDQNMGEQQFKEGTFDHAVRLDEQESETIEGSDRTGSEESSVPGSGI